MKTCRAADATALYFFLSTSRVNPSFIELRTTCNFKAALCCFELSI